jgi:hypothetical protein
LHLLGRHHLNHTASSFCFSYFSNRVSYLWPGLRFSYLCFPPNWDDRCT